MEVKKKKEEVLRKKRKQKQRLYGLGTGVGAVTLGWRDGGGALGANLTWKMNYEMKQEFWNYDEIEGNET